MWAHQTRGSRPLRLATRTLVRAMTLLPILHRELRARARGRATYWARFAVGLLGLLICLPETFFAGSFGLGSSSGGRVFNGVISTAFLLSCSACLLAADAISAERREGTLGLLFLTRIKSLDVLLGKLSSVGITSLCALVAFFPVLMIPVIAGGVTRHRGFSQRPGSVRHAGLCPGRGFIRLGCPARTLPRRAHGRPDGPLLRPGPLLALPRLAFGWLELYRRSESAAPLVYAQDAAYTAAPALYWASLAGVSAIAARLLILAGLRLRRATSDGGGEVLVPPPGIKGGGGGKGGWSLSVGTFQR